MGRDINITIRNTAADFFILDSFLVLVVIRGTVGHFRRKRAMVHIHTMDRPPIERSGGHREISGITRFGKFLGHIVPQEII